MRIGSLDVETHAGLMRGGNQGPVVVPGKATASRLYLTLTGAMEPVMPMGGAKLNESELAVVRAWIDGGARAGAAGLGWGGNVLAAGHGGNVVILGASERVLGTVGAVRAVAVSADGKYVAAAGRLETRVWEVATGREVSAVERGADALTVGVDGRVVAVERRPLRLGDRVVEGMDDGRVRVLRASDMVELAVLGTLGAPVTGLAFSSDGLRLAVLREDGSVRIEEMQ